MTTRGIQEWKKGPDDSPGEVALATEYEWPSGPEPTAVTGVAAEPSVPETVALYSKERGTEDPIKYYWPRPWAGSHATRILLIETDDLGYVVAVYSEWRPLLEEEGTYEGIRGVFSPSYKRKVLFSGEFSIAPSKLKRLRPHVTIDPRRLEREDG